MVQKVSQKVVNIFTQEKYSALQQNNAVIWQIQDQTRSLFRADAWLQNKLFAKLNKTSR